MTCDNQVGVRNITMTFTDCDTGQVYPPLAHQLSGDEQPKYIFCEYDNEPLPGGYVRRNRSNNEMELTVIRHPGIPLALYQGCGAVSITNEHFNGRVVTGVNGTATGRNSSDGHEITITATFEVMDEYLPQALAV